MGRSSRNTTTFSVTSMPFTDDGYGGKAPGVSTTVLSSYSCLKWPVALRNAQYVRDEYGMAADAEVFYATGDPTTAIQVGHICMDTAGVKYTVRAVRPVQGTGRRICSTFLILEKRRA